MTTRKEREKKSILAKYLRDSFLEGKQDHVEKKTEIFKPSSELSPAVFGDFIRTFTFSSSLVKLPIVQPGENIPFPIEVVKPKHVRYIEEELLTGLLVPRGTYRVRWLLNPSDGASISLLVDGKVVKAKNQFPFSHQIKQRRGRDNLINAEYLVQIHKTPGLLSLVNSGKELLTLNDIPNTKIKNTAIITQFQVERIYK
jgi:hypothetical protein